MNIYLMAETDRAGEIVWVQSFICMAHSSLVRTSEMQLVGLLK